MYGEELSSCPKNMGCKQSVWEAWWLKYSADNNLYTLYWSGERAHAVDHREAGYHYKGQGMGRGGWFLQTSIAGHSDTDVGPSNTPILLQLNLGGGIVCQKLGVLGVAS